jgi:hypothetical protein
MAIRPQCPVSSVQLPEKDSVSDFSFPGSSLSVNTFWTLFPLILAYFHTPLMGFRLFSPYFSRFSVLGKHRRAEASRPTFQIINLLCLGEVFLATGNWRLTTIF